MRLRAVKSKDIEMEKLYLESIEKAGSKKEDIARSMYAGFILTDYTVYKQAEEAAGVEIAKKVHKNARLQYIPWIIKDAFEDFRIGEVKEKDVPTTGRIARRIYERTSCPFVVKEDTADRFVGVVLRCPIIPFSMGWSGAMYGAGKTLGPALASVAANWIVKLPLAYVLSQFAGLETSGVWLAIGFSVIVETAINGVYYYKGAWKRSKL